jgi:hypothetical protein
MDALYIDDVKEMIDTLNFDRLHEDIKEKVFPYCPSPFARFMNLNRVFSIKSIKHASRKDGQGSYFVTDTGLLVFVAESIFADFIRHNDYNQFVDAVASPFNTAYWDKVRLNYPPGSIALVLSPGAYSGYDLAGSGQYKIDLLE